MDILVKSRSANKKKFIEAILPSMMRQLKLENRQGTLVIQIEQCEHEGLTVPFPMVGNAYVVVLRSKMKLRALGLSLAHELVHVHQMTVGLLKTLPNGNKTWAGKEIPADTPYLSQPWELQAFARQEIILRHAVQD